MRNNSQKELLIRLEKSIPGGSHTYSKGVDQYPENAPVVLKNGKGAYVFDSEGNKFLDFGMGLKSVILGYGYKKVSNAAFREIKKGNNLSKPSFVELEAAEKLIELIPSAEMVKFAKNGSNVTTAAVKLARSFTGKKYVCVPEEQPFFSFDDWFIGKTVITRGIPEQHSSLTLKFNYNNLNSLETLFDKYPNQIAAVMMEPATHICPCSSSNNIVGGNCTNCQLNQIDNFLVQVQKLCAKNGSLLIFDEIRTGFRWSMGGAQKHFGVIPDLSTFGKSISNGFSVAALVGKREIMNLANINEIGLERTFLLSSTNGAEMGPLGALLATSKICEEKDVANYLWNYGKELQNIIDSLAIEVGIQEYFYTEGPAVSFEIVTKNEKKENSNLLRTLLLQELLKNGLLMTFIAPSFSHGKKELEITHEAFSKALKAYSNALNGEADKLVIGQKVQPVFRKYN